MASISGICRCRWRTIARCDMASIQVRKRTNCLILDSGYKGKRCREQTALSDSATSRRKVQDVRRYQKYCRTNAGAGDITSCAQMYPNWMSACFPGRCSRVTSAIASAIFLNGQFAADLHALPRLAMQVKFTLHRDYPLPHSKQPHAFGRLVGVKAHAIILHVQQYGVQVVPYARHPAQFH